MANLNGLALIALSELALVISLGLVMLLTPTTYILMLNAPTRELAIAKPDYANALVIMMVLLAREPFALITAMIVEHAGLKRT